MVSRILRGNTIVRLNVVVLATIEVGGTEPLVAFGSSFASSPPILPAYRTPSRAEAGKHGSARGWNRRSDA